MEESVKLSLKAARLFNDITLDEAAKTLNVSRQTLSRYEKGETYPTWDLLAKMADLYKMDWRDFILPHC